MKILALDTSNRPLSVAVLEDEMLLAQTTLNMAKKHSATLMPVVADMIKQVGLTPAEIDRVVVAAGPGSYTGLRIGVTAAKTFAFTLNKDLVGISSLEVLAANCQNDPNKLLIPLFDARRKNVFVGGYQVKDKKLVNVLPDQHLGLSELCQYLQAQDQEVLFIGADAKNFQADFAEQLTTTKYSFSERKDDYPSAFVLGLLGKDAQPSDVLNFVPHYLRLTQAEVQWMEKHPGKDQADGSYVEKV